MIMYLNDWIFVPFPYNHQVYIINLSILLSIDIIRQACEETMTSNKDYEKTR